MAESRDHLRLVDSKATKPRREYAGEPLECSCGSRETIETRTGRTIKNGKVSAGRKQIRCYHCKAVLWS